MLQPERARIRNGAYDTGTRDGRGIVGGPMRVRIDSFDGQVTAGLPNGKPTLATYETAADRPRAAAIQDFAIPKAWGEKKLPALPP
ncbi:MAG: hypothetical protein C0501_19120 [Isosphaera sp.]|nr:hypothetical protein [Isosphaera sp.]